VSEIKNGARSRWRLSTKSQRQSVRCTGDVHAMRPRSFISGAIFPRHLDKNNDIKRGTLARLYIYGTYRRGSGNLLIIHAICIQSGGGGVKLMRAPSCINTMGLKEEVVMDDVWSSCR
jgi:hypothetical protein